MRHVNTNKEYCFVLEFERTKQPNDVDSRKFKKLYEYGKFIDLPEDTKILFEYSPRGYNTFFRPMQFQDPITDTKVNSVRHSVQNTLWKYMSKYDDPRFLLVASPDVFWINTDVCLNCKGQWVKLLN